MSGLGSRNRQSTDPGRCREESSTSMACDHELEQPGEYQVRGDQSRNHYGDDSRTEFHRTLICVWLSTQALLARTTDVSTCLGGIDQYVRSSRSFASLGSVVNPLRR